MQYKRLLQERITYMIYVVFIQYFRIFTIYVCHTIFSHVVSKKLRFILKIENYCTLKIIYKLYEIIIVIN